MRYPSDRELIEQAVKRFTVTGSEHMRLKSGDAVVINAAEPLLKRIILRLQDDGSTTIFGMFDVSAGPTSARRTVVLMEIRRQEND